MGYDPKLPIMTEKQQKYGLNHLAKVQIPVVSDTLFRLFTALISQKKTSARLSFHQSLSTIITIFLIFFEKAIFALQKAHCGTQRNPQ